MTPNAFDKLIEAFKTLLGIAKADPADKMEIKRLRLELDAKSNEVALLRAQAPTQEQTDALGALFSEFVQAVTPAAEPEAERTGVEETGSGGDDPRFGIRLAQSVFDARDFFAVPSPAGAKLRCIDGGREADVLTLAEAEAFFSAGSVPPLVGGESDSEHPLPNGSGAAQPPADAAAGEVVETTETDGAIPAEEPASQPAVAANNQPPPAE